MTVIESENSSTTRDILGQVQEYFLAMFASAESKRGQHRQKPGGVAQPAGWQGVAILLQSGWHVCEI